MEAHESLRALIDATLNAIKEIVTGIVAVLLTSKNHLETICFKLILTSRYNLPGKIGLTFTITLCTGIRSAVASIKGNYANTSRRTSGVGGNAIRRIGAFQCLLDRLSFNGVPVSIRIVNRCTFGAHGAINNRK